ncbi:hypothetical protein GS597_08655 [Synechococcales cyanobacterium C]|uniref:Peptide chain release factor 1 n=1 Tax=Petrachloros mirabilis ULC683 TaxID=2781853 RepID=A0A8K1ZZ99_9CYAN|nr:hypothetical protein [Petrachloros mirabilis]NCJ06572.1 hypothetical protein [Petrachloros mirabilis ULC683]
MHQLKSFPWWYLFTVSQVTVAAVAGLDLLLFLGVQRSPILFQMVTPWRQFPGLLLIQVGIGLGIGAISVIGLETFRRVIISGATLWALMGCLLLSLLLMGVISPPGVWQIGPDQGIVVGTLIGVFSRGRRYWR